jgi:prefoldin subunit 5
MTIEQMQKRLAELQELAKQHESILLQISGAIQEYNRQIAEETSKAMAKSEGNDDAAIQVNQ